MKSRWILLTGVFLLLLTALGQFVPCAVVHEEPADAGASTASWQATGQIAPSDACPEGRHLERGSSGIDDEPGRRRSTGSFTLVSLGNAFPHDLLTTSEQRLRQQCLGQQAPLQILQCSWLI
ncbi:MAG: hypothetical protein QM703_04650 [Gemmatales bacterium]